MSVGILPAASTVRDILEPPTDEETLELFRPLSSDPVADIEAQLQQHPLVLSLRADPSFQVESRPHLKMPSGMRPHNLTGGTLAGEDKISVPPLSFSTTDGSKFVSIQHLGRSLCGHPGIVHGGLLATLLDEGLARCCFPALPNRIGVTASLKIDYRMPTKADQFVVLKAWTTKVEGRKAWVKGRLETLTEDGSDGKILVEAEALFVEPKNAAVSIHMRPLG